MLHLSKADLMKTTPRLILVAFLFFTVFLPALTFNFPTKAQAANRSDGDFFLGVTYGGNSVTEAKDLIDKVHNYTNLFVVDSAEISGGANSSALDQICDYAVHANMSIIVYFYMIYYNVTSNISTVYNASTWEDYGVSPWHVQWLNGTKEKFGDKFLGVYLFDEPGGKQIDLGYWGGNNVTFAGTPVRTFANVTGYDDAANRYVTSIANNRGMQILSNTSYPNGLNFTIPAFTADYALYWFDYKAGYSTVFAELGGVRGETSKIQQIALCRGAAKAYGKDWGVMVTWASSNPPTPENGTDMLADLTMAYNAGAKYAIAFNYNLNGTGGLTEDDFNALKQVWTNVHLSPRSGELSAQVVFMLPENYGWGMRTPDDKIWGLWSADNMSWPLWQNLNRLLLREGTNLDIVYSDSQVSIASYSQMYSWTATITGPTITPTPVPTPTPEPTPNATEIPPTPSPEPTSIESTIPTIAPTETASPTLSPTPAKVAESPNVGVLIVAAVVPTAVVLCGLVYRFTRPKKRNPSDPVFPQVPVKATLQGFGKGIFKLEGEAIWFRLKARPFAKKSSVPQEIELSKIDSLKRIWNQIAIEWLGKTNNFTFGELDVGLVYACLSDALAKKERNVEKVAVLPEQKELAQKFAAVAATISPLFDAIKALHGAVDWSYVESCIGRCREAARQESTAGAEFAGTSLAVVQRQPEEAAREAQSALTQYYARIRSLVSTNAAFEQFHPNYDDFKRAVLAYYMINDIMLGVTVGDDVNKEKQQLAAALAELSKETNSILNPSLLESIRRLSGDSSDNFTEIRTLLAEQLKAILTPPRI